MGVPGAITAEVMLAEGRRPTVKDLLRVRERIGKMKMAMLPFNIQHIDDRIEK